MMPPSAARELGDGLESVFFDDEVERQFLKLVRSAKRHVTFVAPFVTLWDDLKAALLDAKDRKISVTFLLKKGANRRRPEDLKWLSEKVTVCYVSRLHAKIYLNEE